MLRTMTNWRFPRALWLAIACLVLAPLATGPVRAEEYRFPAAERLVVVGDVHGAYQRLVDLLTQAGLLDEQLHWSGGETVLVSTGDFLDRGARSRDVMDLLMRLQSQAPRSGGRVHVLLGNHELMNLVGDLRDVSQAEFLSYAEFEDVARRQSLKTYYESLTEQTREVAFDSLYPPGWFGHRRAFAPDGKYGRWLRTLPFLIVVGDRAFAHGGLPPMVAELGLEQTNRALHQTLADYNRQWARISRDAGVKFPPTFRQRPRVAEASGLPVAEEFERLYWQPLFSPAGPVWSREASMCLPVTVEDRVDASLQRLGARQLVVGHTVTNNRRIASRLDGRVLMIDTGMLDTVYKGGEASALVVEQGQASAMYLGGDGLHEIQPAPRQVGPRPAFMGDDELELFMAEARVVEIKDLGSGITRPQKVTLEKDGLRIHAIFKDVRHREQRLGNAIIEYADHWQNEIAAYRLDRMLGLDVVPVTIEREIQGVRGSLQFWVDGMVSLRTVEEKGMVPGNWCDMEPQYQLLKVFDALIHNLDRTQENLAFERTTWKLVLFDHSRAFAARSRILQKVQSEYLQVTDALASRLRALDEDSLSRVMGPYLSRGEIRNLLARRNMLLENYAAPPVERVARAR